jgi:hypothetical protein
MYHPYQTAGHGGRSVRIHSRGGRYRCSTDPQRPRLAQMFVQANKSQHCDEPTNIHLRGPQSIALLKNIDFPNPLSCPFSHDPIPSEPSPRRHNTAHFSHVVSNAIIPMCGPKLAEPTIQHKRMESLWVPSGLCMQLIEPSDGIWRSIGGELTVENENCRRAVGFGVK